MTDDYRYTMTVFLIREGRPKYWTFHCPYCTAKVCELDGSVVQVRDVINETSGTGTRIRCPGSNIKQQGYCRMWFEFRLQN